MDVIRRRWRAGVVALAAAGLALGACSSDGDGNDGNGGDDPATVVSVEPFAEGEAPLRVEQIAAAVAAVETELGGPQQYFEINATPTIINLFLAADDATQAVAYVYVAGDLGDPAEPLPASGPTFASADIDFDAGLVLAKARAELPTSDFRLFSITGIEAGGAQYRAVVQSAQGTEFALFLSANGSILGTDQGLEAPTTEGGS